MMLHSDDFQSQVLRDLDRELQDGGVTALEEFTATTLNHNREK